MNTDMVVDDEFETGQPYAGIGDRGDRESAAGVADIEHHLSARPRHAGGVNTLDFEGDASGVDAALRSFGAADRHFIAVAQDAGRVTCAHNARQPKLTGDDSRVRSAPALVGDEGRDALHHRLPIRIGHLA